MQMDSVDQNVKSGGIQYWHKIVIILCLGWVSIWIYRSVLTPIFPEIQASLNVTSNAEMGLIASFYFFAYTGMQIPAGMLVDRFGQKVVLIPGFLLFTAAALVIGNASSLSMVYLGSLMAGIGCGSYYGSAYSLSSKNIPAERRGLATAIINSGSAVGMGIGLIASSFFVKSLKMDWQIMLYMIAAILFLMVLVFAIVIKTPPKEEKPAVSTSANMPDSPVTVGGKANLFTSKMIAAYIIYFATCYGYYMVVTWLPSFLQQERGFEGVAIGFSSALVAFSAIPGALFFSRMSDKFRDRKVGLIIFLEICAAVMLIVTVIAPNSTILLIGLILYGLLGKLAVEPILISYVADHAPKTGYGTSFGVFNFFGMSSSVIAPFLTGVISDQLGSKQMGFYISAIILVVGTAVFFFSNLKKSK